MNLHVYAIQNERWLISIVSFNSWGHDHILINGKHQEAQDATEYVASFPIVMKYPNATAGIG